MTQEEIRLSESGARKNTGSAGAPISANAHGAPSVKTTAPTATRGNTFHMITPVPGHTAGTKTDSPASRIAIN